MAARTIIGVDVGGTKSALALYDAEDMKLLHREAMPTNAERGFPHVLEDIVVRIEAHKDETTVGVGVGVPGFVRQPEGVIERLPNIPKAENFRLREELSKRFALPVAIDNDSNCFTLGEAMEGCGKGHAVVVGITMGTGVGGGIVINGKLFRGAHGFAGEIGHTLLLPGGPPFETEDKRGEVEQFLSGTALRKRCTDAKQPEDLLSGDACAFLHPEIVRETAWLCASITHFFDPSLIVIGGSTGRALRPYLTAIEEECTRWIEKGTPLPLLKIGELEDAATRGAAMLACS